MSEQTKILLNLINEGYTLNQICELMGLSHKQVFNLFRMMYSVGYDFDRCYYSNGDIRYNIGEIGKVRDTSIITKPCENDIKIMVISDLHLGCSYENIKAINMIYDYCVRNEIHIIFNAGDLVDGINIGNRNNKFHDNGYDQIRYADSVYPFDKSIINFITFGNHDIDLYNSFGINLMNFFYNFRHDIVPLGYGEGVVNIKNNKFLIKHKINDIKFDSFNEFIPICLKGHSHIYRVKVDSANQGVIYVPTLSNFFLSENTFLPQAVLLDLSFNNGYINYIKYNQLLVGDKINIVSTIEQNVNLVKGNVKNNISNEEDYKVRILEPSSSYANSQISKFNSK